MWLPLLLLLLLLVAMQQLLLMVRQLATQNLLLPALFVLLLLVLAPVQADVVYCLCHVVWLRVHWSWHLHICRHTGQYICAGDLLCVQREINCSLILLPSQHVSYDDHVIWEVVKQVEQCEGLVQQRLTQT